MTDPAQSIREILEGGGWAPKQEKLDSLDVYPGDELVQLIRKKMMFMATPYRWRALNAEWIVPVEAVALVGFDDVLRFVMRPDNNDHSMVVAELHRTRGEDKHLSMVASRSERRRDENDLLGIVRRLEMWEGSPPAVHDTLDHKPLCGFTEEQADKWPPGHKTNLASHRKVTCSVCRAVLAKVPW